MERACYAKAKMHLPVLLPRFAAAFYSVSRGQYADLKVPFPYRKKNSLKRCVRFRRKSRALQIVMQSSLLPI